MKWLDCVLTLLARPPSPKCLDWQQQLAADSVQPYFRQHPTANNAEYVVRQARPGMRSGSEVYKSG